MAQLLRAMLQASTMRSSSIASDEAVQAYNLKPRAKIIASTAVGVEPALWVLLQHPPLKITQTSQPDFRADGCN